MTPAQYAAKFLNLYLFLPQPPDDDDGPRPVTSMYLPDRKAPNLVAGDVIDPGIWRRVKVDLYRLKGSPQAGILYSTLKSKLAFFDVRVMCINGSVETYTFKPDDIKYALAAPFFGKGYPEECQIVLQLWHRYCSNRLDINSLIATAGIGLDCNGFVGGYIDRLKAPANWHRKGGTHTGDMINGLLGNHFFNSWDMLQPPGAQCLLFGECDANGNVADHSAGGGTGHIMITEPGTLAKTSATGPATVDVVESTGPVGTVGLQRSRCTILSMPKRGVFRIQRGVPSKKNTPQEFMNVRIVQLRAP
jgi:hypothetical protein